MSSTPAPRTTALRVLIANEHLDRLARVAAVLEGLGHEVVARTVTVADVAAASADERPDVAIVGLGASSEHALGLVSEIVREAYCPVIALLEQYDHAWLREAAARGVFAYVVESNTEELQGAIEITLHRFAEIESLKSAVERRTAEAAREKQALTSRKRQTLELHDGVVQGLVAAQLAHDLGREEESGEALFQTLTRAKSLVSRSLAELRIEGLTTRELIHNSAAGDVNA